MEQEFLQRFEDWYSAEMPRLFNYVCYRLSDRSAAEELTANICLLALSRADQFKPDKGTLSNWIFGIARNTIRNHFRAERRQARQVSLDALPEIIAEHASPDQALELRERFMQIVEGLHQLPEIEQEIVALRYGGDLSNAEIAQIMDLKKGHVAVMLHRSIKKLQKYCLQNEMGAHVQER